MSDNADELVIGVHDRNGDQVVILNLAGDTLLILIDGGMNLLRWP